MRMLHRCRNDWLGPLRNIAQLAPAHDLAALRVEDQYRLWSSARVWIGFFAVVVHLEFSQHRDKLDQVHETSVIPLEDLCHRNIMPASRDSGTHARDVEIRTAQAHVQHAYLESPRQRFVYDTGDCFPSKRSLEGEVESFGDCAFQESFSLVPCFAIRLQSSDPRIGKYNLACCLVGIEILAI